MLSLLLLWLLIGLVIGSLAWMARCSPPSWQSFRWLRMLALGVVIAFVAGWLGALLLGQFFATILSLWVTIVGVAVLPRGTHWLHARLHLGSRLRSQ